MSGAFVVLSAVSDLNVSGDVQVLLGYVKVEFIKLTPELGNFRSDISDLLASKLKEFDKLNLQVVSFEKQVKKNSRIM